MEFPFGHHHRHHHRGDDEEELPPEAEPHPPVHHRGGDGEEWRSEFEPPPPHHHRRGEGEEEWRPEFEPPPPVHYGRPEGQYDRPDYPPVEHVSHEVHRPPFAHGNAEEGHYGRPYEGYGRAEEGAADRVPTVRVFTKAEENYSLSIRDGAVILARSDPNDEFQHWIKDMKYSTRVKDEEGFPSFALVNKATGQALKHSIGATHPVRLIPYNPDYLDESVLWTESNDLGDGFRCIRMVNNIRLNFDAFHGDEDHGGVHDGTTLVLWEWLKGNNQRWKIVPHCKFLMMPTYNITNKT